MFFSLAKVRPSRFLLCLPIMALLCGLFAFGWPAQAQEAAMVSVDINKSRAMSDENKIVATLTADNAAELYATEFIMSFNPDELQVVDADPDKDGYQIGAGDCTANQMNINLVENTTGAVRYASMELSGRTTKDPQSCTIAQITFEVQSEEIESSTLHFEDVILVGPTAEIEANVPSSIDIPTNVVPTAVTLAESGTHSPSRTLPLLVLGLTIVAGGSIAWRVKRRRPLLCLALIVGMLLFVPWGVFAQTNTNNTNNNVNRAQASSDLLVPAVKRGGTTTNAQALTISGNVSVQLRNQDTLDVTDPFQVKLFEDRDGDGLLTAGDNILGQQTHSSAIAAGETVTTSIAVSGDVLFRHNLIYAFADSEDVIAESQETNNYNHSGASCQFRPPVGGFDPQLEWEWTGSGSTLPTSNQVMMAPAVIDLTADGIPDVVFATFAGRNYNTNGHLRAINGHDGSEIFTVTDASYDVRPMGSVAVGDIDLDGQVEILAVHESSNNLLAFEHDGTFKWQSPVVSGGIDRGGAAIADIDEDGTPEIVVGATVLNHDGTARWAGANGRGDNGYGPLSLVADLDLADHPEIVAGNSAYRSDGTLYWHNSSLADGFNATGNFDEDAFPEIVLVSSGKVYLLEHDGTLKWGPVAVPGGGRVGAPTVADVDGDDEPEIGVAGGSNYVVLETDGAVKWSSPTQDNSSNVTGSSVFDFEGDGLAEVIYSDELKLRIYRGTDGTVLWETPSPSATTYELPLIVDVDADGNTEIVMISNNYAFAGSTGVQVYGDANDTWVPTRQIWNQHTYHITNVNDDGTIPQNESASWQTHNTYRLNLPTAGDTFAAPDLTASQITIDNANLPSSATISARIGNGGGIQVGAGVEVAFYDGDPEDGGALIAVTTTIQPLAPGEYEDVTITWDSPPDGEEGTIYVVADDDGTSQGAHNECDETNNDHSVVHTFQKSTTLILDPPTHTMKVSETITIDVIVNHVVDLRSIQFALEFNKDVLEVVDADSGQDGLQITPGSCPQPDFVVVNEAHNDTGVVEYAATSFSASCTPSPSGLVAQIAFHAHAGGKGQINFTTWGLSNSLGQSIEVDDTQGASIIVEDDTKGDASGTVRLLGREIHWDTAQPYYNGATVKVIDSDETVIATATTNAAGEYQLADLPVGTYTVTAEMDLYLDAERTLVVQQDQTTALPHLVLWPGENNGDRKVNILDLQPLFQLFNAGQSLASGITCAEEPNWDPSSEAAQAKLDFNADCHIDVRDIALHSTTISAFFAGNGGSSPVGPDVPVVPLTPGSQALAPTPW